MIVLIDDRRCFMDDRDHVLLRTPSEGVNFFGTLPNDAHIDELWLDHDMGWEGTIMPVVTLLEKAAVIGAPYSIGKIWIHTANPSAQDMMVRSLTARGYNVQAINGDWEGIFMDMDVKARMDELKRRREQA